MPRSAVIISGLLGLFGIYSAYHLSTAPIPTDPASWEAPPHPGLTGVYSPNGRLTEGDLISVSPHEGPEDIVLTKEGRLLTGTSDGHILEIHPETATVTSLGQTGGRPLGLALDAQGTLYVADAMLGLLQRQSDGQFRVICERVEDVPTTYADDVVVSKSGRVFFTDASSRFSPRDHGGPYEASRLDLVEHRPSGRLIECDPKTGEGRVLARDLAFANGLTLSHDETFLLVVETGEYRIRRHWLAGPRAGRTLDFADSLPGFPDNITRGLDGRYWVGLVSPRNALLDALSGSPSWRRVLQRLPRWMQPDAARFGHVIALNGEGETVVSLQDPTGRISFTVAVQETPGHLYVSRLKGQGIVRVPNGLRAAQPK